VIKSERAKANKRAHDRLYKKNNRSKARASERDRAYGKGANDHAERKRIEQGNCCAVCNKEFTDTPHLDHNHITGKWRGVLCDQCNRGLGMFKESLDSLQKAINYLRFWA